MGILIGLQFEIGQKWQNFENYFTIGIILALSVTMENQMAERRTDRLHPGGWGGTQPLPLTGLLACLRRGGGAAAKHFEYSVGFDRDQAGSGAGWV